MKVLRNTSYLCGHFSMNNWQDFAETLKNAGWLPDVPDADVLSDKNKHYQSEFIDFIYHNSKVNPKSRKSKLDGIVRFKKVIDKSILLKIKDKDAVKATVDSIRFYLAPFNIVIFSIAVRMENVDYDDMSMALLMMRDICNLSKENAGEFVERAINPIYDIYLRTRGKTESFERVDLGSSELDFQVLTKTGNKFKLFQINEIDDLKTDKCDRMLYDMGRLAPLSDVEDSDDIYYKKALDAGKVAVSKDWRALAIFDSYTVISSPVSDNFREKFASEHFGIIYIYLLFSHAFLLEYDMLFRTPDCDITELEKDIVLLERRYSFNRFSFDSELLEISMALERALEVQNCINNLHNMVTQASGVYEKDSNEKMNNVLTFLAVITTCSTVWDLFSLLDAAYTFGFDGIGYLGFRIGVYILIIMMLMVFFVFKKTHKRG